MYYETVENIELTDEMFNNQVLVIHTPSRFYHSRQLLKLIERHHKTGYVWCSSISKSSKIQVSTRFLTWPPPHKKSFTVEELFGSEELRIKELVKSKAQGENKNLNYGTIRGS